MAIDKLGPAAGPSAAEAVRPKESFGKVLSGAQKAEAPRSEVAPVRIAADPGQVSQAKAAGPVHGPKAVGAAQPTASERVAKTVEAVRAAQDRLERVLALAQSGKDFKPAELLALQANVYRASQEIDLAGKVVDKATSGLKQVLTTNV